MNTDFASMMTATGARPLHAPRPAQHQPARPQPAPLPPVATPRPAAPSWAIGTEGMAILDRAMRGISRNGALRRPNGQIVMLVPRDGGLVDAGDPGMVVTSADLLRHADAIGCEMIVIAWDGRKAVFHPLSGAAVITEDPRGEPA
jgi:hypothetical protein